MKFSKLEKLEERARKAWWKLDQIQTEWEKERARIKHESPIAFRDHCAGKGVIDSYNFGDILA